MKMSSIIIASLAIGFSSISQAGLTYGVKAGTMQIGFDDVEVSSDPSSIGVSIGYDFAGTNFGVEAEVTRSLSPGEVIGVDLEVESQGIYLTYTTSGKFYFSGRLGFMDAGLVAEGLSEDEGGETYGIAAGYRLGERLRVEVDYTSIDDDINFISIGLKF